MDSIYTTTITQAARRRGIGVDVLNAEWPIFTLRRRGCAVRCYNALTDRVGAVTFHLAQDKHLANQFLARHGISVPRQVKYTDWREACRFLRQCRSVVVKPCREWGGRGVSVAVRTPAELRAALRRARTFGEDRVIEECVSGIDHRVIIVNDRFAAAIVREPARVIGDGRHTVRELIRLKNAQARREDPSHVVPLDGETLRAVRAAGCDYASVPRRGRAVTVRRTSNYHTGGAVREVTATIDRTLVTEARRIARAFGIPVLGVDFLVQPGSGRRWVIEVSPDLAISPPEGARVAEYFLDYLFPPCT